MPSTERLTAHQIFERAHEAGHTELLRPARDLLFSGLAAGIAMGMSGVGTASLRAAGAPDPVAFLLYPSGFIVVIVGRMQLFTENTLYPVLVAFENPRRIPDLLRLWALVLAANVTGALVFALLIAQGGAGGPVFVDALSSFGRELLTQKPLSVFSDAIVGGWAVALVAWIVSVGRDLAGQIAMIWLLVYIIGVGHFDHSVVGLGEGLVAVLTGAVAPGNALPWFAAAVTGNVCGGVVLVSLTNYGQVAREKEKRR